MELKSPIKKGIKTPRSRPPLPMLNESPSGYRVDEYEWPLFTGYYNGTSVIVDDSHAMSLLTNKGFFGKGSLSKGCPNVTKRKIPINVVYESQWKRRKMWIESLNVLLENRKKCNATLESNVNETDKKESNEREKIEVGNEKNGSQQNDSSKTEQNSCETRENEYNQNKSNKTSIDNMVDNDDKKSIIEEKMEIDIEKNDSTKIEVELSETSEDKDNGGSKNKSVVSSKDNVIDIDNKSGDLEKMVVDKEKNNSENICPIVEEQPKTSQNKENGDDEILPDMKQTIKESGQAGLCKSDKNEESTSNPVDNTLDENKLMKDNVKIVDDNDKMTEDSTSIKVADNQSKCVRKSNSSNNTEKSILNINEVLVIPDTDGELEQYFLNLKPCIEEEKVKTAIEVLYLSLEEAFFLSYACKCLQIFDLTSNILRSRDMWVLFLESQPDFIERYVAYHYFRAKGWVVKSGTKFGGDFLLYKKGPLYFHASYIVIVEVLKNNKNSRNKTTWQRIVGMNRMAESSNKEILICHVFWPDVEEEKFNDPAILKEFGVSETLLRRWQATHEKTP